MLCEYGAICPFYHKKKPVHDAVYTHNVSLYCEGEPAQCAIHMALEKVTFLDLPDDLLPNQTFRLKTILGETA